MVAGDRHRPGLVAGVEAGQEPGRVVDILARIEHVLDAAKMRCVVVVVDLHAAKIDQRLAVTPGRLEGGKRLAPALRENRFSLYIHGVRLKAAFPARFGKTDGIENARRHAIAIGGTQDLRLARVGGGFCRARREAR